jgi:hypothetical protein
VMTHGEWRVVDGRHVGREHALAEYATVVRRLYGEQARAVAPEVVSS